MTANQQVLILGGSGRIGSSVAADIVAYTPARVLLAGRNPIAGEEIARKLGEKAQFVALELDALAPLHSAIAQSNLVIHCAGPFHHRDGRVLKHCIETGVPYLDVSDHRSFTQKALQFQTEAERAGVTAIVNTGIFPGISNSMVRRGVEWLDRPDRIHLSYVVAGSGGAGLTVMRTTFLGLQHPFEAWIEGKWQTVKPYSDRETVTFPSPYDRAGVYWYDMPETFTLPATFPVQTAITKFGSVPDLYNYLTWWVAKTWPNSWLQNRQVIEFLSTVSYKMTQVSDRFSGIGVAIRSEVSGLKAGNPATHCSTLVHENTAVAAGGGTGSLAQLILDGRLHKPGVWPVEAALPTDLFEETMQARGIKICDVNNA
ncbi:saccharopine dehydrogenase NADP-binding domain-containing protein [Oscillatoria sp. FACHB-1406]|uniref:saccharopine dehydrogenase family protein n=1 Tax=Oscillatoria sp. FACHB-1406 TaxID=2692846 RepID=UPI00168A1110|nr:saccharopine dehydrogenase NADP-binding domain-containing protein [Oscillatoria sp. FACHB-1406]MBD2579882.1 saccharopine dehydrogenase NADP-binding domain-containing protein [Oscillatoria sp. FACHB-1406]